METYPAFQRIMLHPPSHAFIVMKETSRSLRSQHTANGVHGVTFFKKKIFTFYFLNVRCF